MELIFRLLEVANTEKKLEAKYFRKRRQKIKKGAKNTSLVSRIFNEVKLGIKEINKLIEKEMRNNSFPKKNFILFNSKKGNYEIFISDKFQW